MHILAIKSLKIFTKKVIQFIKNKIKKLTWKSLNSFCQNLLKNYIKNKIKQLTKKILKSFSKNLVKTYIQNLIIIFLKRLVTSIRFITKRIPSLILKMPIKYYLNLIHLRMMIIPKTIPLKVLSIRFWIQKMLN